MCLLSVQFGLQPTLTKTFTPDGVCRSTVVLVQEGLKFCFAYIMLRISGAKQSAVVGWTPNQWIRVAFLPAALYALQNMAALQAYQHLDSLTFNVLNQTKTLSAAMCCYLVMGKRQSFMQIFSLILLLLSALTMEGLVPLESLMFRSSNVSTSQVDWNSTHWSNGVAPILLASFISGLSGALSQRNLQSSGGGRNPYLFSMELCSASILILGSSLVFSNDGKRVTEDGFWAGWVPQLWIPITTNAIGGIIVGLVTKYAGSVRKGFALIFGIFLSGVVQAMLDQSHGVSREQVAGGVLAGVSLWIHATHPYQSKKLKNA
ncbi:unnamed protein product [Cylindrotheca closterium]|uniref:Nucleotide-sugar transporter n=1 Tax=Cylindrotheca closterium TaxID=2856 RepID=A0AAD2JP60_9STRA|nr:unnamed protein product [Cylindrotheca closterium]